MGMVVTHVDPVHGPGVPHRGRGVDAHFPGDDIVDVMAEFGNAGAAGGVGERVNPFDRLHTTIVDLEDFRRRERGDQKSAVGPHGDALDPRADGELVKDFDGQRERGIVPVEPLVFVRRRQRGSEQRGEQKYGRDQMHHDGSLNVSAVARFPPRQAGAGREYG